MSRTGNAAIDRYLELDVGEDSKNYRDLMAKADAEAASQPIRLLGEAEAGAISGGITPAMGGWYNSKIGPARSAALAEVEAMGRAIKVGKNPGTVREIEEDRLRRHQMTRRAEIHTNFSNENRERIAELDEIRDEYKALRNYEGGRDAKHPHKWVDFAIPLAILIPESFLNYESFMSSPLIQTGIMALGVTVVTGVAIGFAAFLAGRFWKAYHFYMRPDDDRQKQKGLRMIWIASTLLTFALAVVAAARYYYILPKIEEAEILGLTPPNLIWSTSSLLLGNIVVFFLGAAFTYWMHDENPEYAEKFLKLEEKKSAFDRIKRNALIARLREVDRAFEQDRERISRISRQIETMDGYSDLRAGLSAIEGKDLAIIGAMQDYRERLTGMLVDDGDLFEVPDGIRQSAITDSSFTKQEFCSLPIKLYRC